MTRRSFTALDKLKVMVAQARCALCNEKLVTLAETEFDHIQALARGGADTVENLRAVHADCHRIKTSGRPATTLGSDIHEIAKSPRLLAKEAQFRARLLAKEHGTETPEPKRKHKIPRSPKRQAKPQRTATRPLAKPLLGATP